VNPREIDEIISECAARVVAAVRAEKERGDGSLSADQVLNFCRFLEKEGYIDSDWWAERPTVWERYTDRGRG
jgi:hypothetical protein